MIKFSIAFVRYHGIDFFKLIHLEDITTLVVKFCPDISIVSVRGLREHDKQNISTINTK